MVQEHIAIIYWFVDQKCSKRLHIRYGRDELVSEMMVAVCVSAQYWQAGKGKFLTYAIYSMKRKACDLALKKLVVKETIENPDACTDDSDPHSSEVAEAIMHAEGLLKRKVASLKDPRSKAVIRKLYGIGGETRRSANKVAWDLRVCRQTVENIKKAAIGQLREAYGVEAA
jgi:RNA polymerase sigma factor (sigma-70 family)